MTVVVDDLTRNRTYLVIYLLGGIGQLDGLLKYVADLLHLLALGPIVESAGDIHLLGGVRPKCVEGQMLAMDLIRRRMIMGSGCSSIVRRCSAFALRLRW